MPVHTNNLSLTFRAATKQDVKALRRLEKEAFPGEDFEDVRLSKRDFKDMLKDDDYHVLLAETPAGEMAGYVLVDCADDDMSAANIDSLAVAKEFRRHGIAATLLARAEEIATRADFPALDLEVFDDNKVAICFYEKNGYQRHDYDGECEQILFRKKLSGNNLR